MDVRTGLCQRSTGKNRDDTDWIFEISCGIFIVWL